MCAEFSKRSIFVALLYFLTAGSGPAPGPGPSSVHCANILGVFTSHSPSHLIVHMSVMKALAERGHNVTVVSALQPKITQERIKHFVIGVSAQAEQEIQRVLGNIVNKELSALGTVRNLLGSLGIIIDKQYEVVADKRFTALYDLADTKYDLLILGYFLNSYQLGIAAKFKCPVIISFPGGNNEFLDGFVGNPTLLSHVPNMHTSVKRGHKMSFVQRFLNLFSSGVMRLVNIFIEFRMQKFYNQLYADDPNMPEYAQLLRNISLVFCNGHMISEGPIRANVPALVEIGGIQIKDKPDALPQDIAEFLDAKNAKHGAILFSLGSNLKAQYLQPATVKIIFETLSQLKQRVLWKWDDIEHTPGTSKNIMYKQWLPQDDVLAHANLKLFITHAGKGGIAEAQYHAVPMLALPVFADQFSNADMTVDAGYGLRLSLAKLQQTEFSAALSELLHNRSYAYKVTEFSKLYRDRPLTARQTVIYWTEYVLRYHGAAHMQSPLVQMNVIESNNFDIYIILIGILLLLFFTFKKIFGCICRKRKSSKQKISNRNKNK